MKSDVRIAKLGRGPQIREEKWEESEFLCSSFFCNYIQGANFVFAAYIFLLVKKFLSQ